MKHFLSLISLITFLFLLTNSFAFSEELKFPEHYKQVKENILKHTQDKNWYESKDSVMVINDLTSHGIKDIYEVVINNNIYLFHKSGKYIFFNGLYDVSKGTNITKKRFHEFQIKHYKKIKSS